MKVIVNLFNTNRSNNISISYFIIYCICLLLLRVKITESIFMLFLVWNLILAAIPYLLLLTADSYKNIGRIGIKRGALLFTWLLFLPNSFYIVTDLIHLTKSSETTIWLDILILSSFSMTGFYMGILSILEFEKISTTLFSTKIVNLLLPVICFLCGFGIYLGRILRYNSWDIISNPQKLIMDIGIELSSRDSLFFSALFGFFIYSIYLISKIKKNNTDDHETT